MGEYKTNRERRQERRKRIQDKSIEYLKNNTDDYRAYAYEIGRGADVSSHSVGNLLLDDHRVKHVEGKLNGRYLWVLKEEYR